MPVQGTKLLEAVKGATVISTYVSGTPIAPAAGALAVYVDLAVEDRHREVEVIERLGNLIDRAREENYDRASGVDTLYYFMRLRDGKEGIQKTIDPSSLVLEYEPPDGTVIDFVDGLLEDDTITDSTAGFLVEGFEAGKDVVVTGSTSNDGTYTPTAVTAGTMTFATGTLAATEPGINGVTFTSTIKAISEGDVAIGINTSILSGNRGSMLIDSCFQQIIDWMAEQHRLTV